MKKVVVKVLVCVMMTTMILTGCGSTEEKECKAVITAFQNACNSLDINDMLDCIEPEIADTARVLISLMGEDSTEILDTFSQGLIFGMNLYDGEATGVFESIKIDVEELKVENEYAVADCIVSCMIDGEKIETYAEIEMELLDEAWYITNIYFEE